MARLPSIIKQLFYRAGPRYRQQFLRFSLDSLRLSSVHDLAVASARFLTESLPASKVDFLLREEDGERYRSVLTPVESWLFNSLLQGRLLRERRAVQVSDMLQACPHETRSLLEPFRGGYAAPLRAEETLAGVLLVGAPASAKAYTADQAEFLSTFANGVSVVLERNALIEKVRAEEFRTAKMEKLASLGRLTAGIAHEFRNPLNIISTAAQTILRNPDDTELHRETARYIVEEANRLNRTVEEFLEFVRPHTPVWECGRLETVVESALQSLRPAAVQKQIRIENSVPAGLPDVTSSPRHLERVLVNLGMNAIEAMEPGGTLTVRAALGENDTVWVSVADTGPGIPAEHHARLFDPFFTTKPSGTGLGLVIVYTLLQLLRGTITFTTGSTGTAFRVTLPVDGSKLL